jgi:hypothetical protein
MTAIHRARLLKLAEFLETRVPRKEFYMGSWLICDAFNKSSGFKKGCGMSACAGGWAAQIPSFRRAGLSTNFAGVPEFNYNTGFDAMASFFRITYDTACDLFLPASSNETPKQVATRFRRYLKSVKP